MLTSTGVNLTGPGSRLPSLHSNKEEGQANFVNPGIYIFNAGADFNLTTNLRAFANTSYLRFDRTEPLEILLFQSPIRHSISEDVGFGVKYRPKLNENIVVTWDSCFVPRSRSAEYLQQQGVALRLWEPGANVLITR
jgi:hypothetical protein